MKIQIIATEFIPPHCVEHVTQGVQLDLLEVRALLARPEPKPGEPPLPADPLRALIESIIRDVDAGVRAKIAPKTNI